MNFSTKKTLFMIVAVVLLVTLACGSSNTISTDESTLGVDVATEAPVENTVESVETVAPVPDSPWYVDNFDSNNLDTWTEFYFTQKSDTEYESETSVKVEDGGVLFDINIPETYIYLFNENFTYDDVSVEFEVENTGPHNSQYINLVCRYTPDAGWYEFSVAASGMVQLWRYSFDDGYILIEEGGSTDIRQGNATNTYKMTCVGNELSLFINGEPWRSAFKDSNYRKGYIGFSAGSMNVTPVQVFFTWVEVSQP
jgi:hypothetical protein